MFLTLEQRLKGARVALAVQAVFSLGLWAVLAYALFIGTGEFAIGFREEFLATGVSNATVFLVYSAPIVIAVVVAGVTLFALRKRTRVLSLVALTLLALEIAAGLANGGFPLFVAVALLLLARRDVMEYLNAWPKKST